MSTDRPFTSLIRTLTELDYTAGDAVDGITVYAHRDGRGLLVTVDTARRAEARVSRRNDDGDSTWMIRFTADTPDQMQRAIVMLALRFDTDGQPADPEPGPDTAPEEHSRPEKPQ